jgi:hypothetical protein
MLGARKGCPARIARMVRAIHGSPADGILGARTQGTTRVRGMTLRDGYAVRHALDARLRVRG